jgi:PTH1 family peptidyl-tRNA hydrolase
MLAGQDVLLVKPLTFMNRSGVAVERVLGEQGGQPQDLIVVLDDVALPLDTLRLRERGSHGGHNGLRSLIDVLGTDEFPRLRLGVGRGDEPAFDISPFPPEEVLVVQELVGRAGDAVACLLEQGVGAAMNAFNGPRKA